MRYIIVLFAKSTQSKFKLTTPTTSSRPPLPFYLSTLHTHKNLSRFEWGKFEAKIALQWRMNFDKMWLKQLYLTLRFKTRVRFGLGKELTVRIDYCKRYIKIIHLPFLIDWKSFLVPILYSMKLDFFYLAPRDQFHHLKVAWGKKLTGTKCFHGKSYQN